MNTNDSIVNIWENQNIVTPVTEYFMKIYYVTQRAKGKVLDVGCSNGYMGKLLDQKVVTEYIGMEINDFVLKYVPEGVKVVKHDLTKAPWPFQESYFDTVLWLEGPELFIDPSVIYREIHRVIKPKGLLILATPKFIRFLSPIFPRMYEYDIQEIVQELMEHQFTVLGNQEVYANTMTTVRKLYLIDVTVGQKYGSDYWDKRAASEGSAAVVTPGKKEDDEKNTKEQVEFLKTLVDFSGKNVLDAGCGIGRLTRPLKPLCKSIKGMDFSAEMIKRASIEVPNVDFIHAALGMLLPFQNEEFDITVCWYVLMHILEQTRWQAAVAEVKRITKDVVIVSESLRDTWKGGEIAPHCVLRSFDDYVKAFAPFKLKKRIEQDVKGLVSTVMVFERPREANKKRPRGK